MILLSNIASDGRTVQINDDLQKIWKEETNFYRGIFIKEVREITKNSEYSVSRSRYKPSTFKFKSGTLRFDQPIRLSVCYRRYVCPRLLDDTVSVTLDTHYISEGVDIHERQAWKCLKGGDLEERRRNHANNQPI
jgi:hypothetical protein